MDQKMAEEIIPAADTQSFQVFHSAEVSGVRRAAKQMAAQAGLDTLGCEEVALVVCELANNLLKHAGGGRLVMSTVAQAARSGLQIESIDSGPGIADHAKALTDGYSTAGSLGDGLGAVNRLMDEFAILPKNGRGAHILCRKWAKANSTGLLPCPYEIGVASRPKPGFDVNGDDFVVKHWQGYTLVGVIDGLGHGEPAHVAAQAARNFVLSHYDQGLEVLFRGVGFACSSTRGCVMALARFDWDSRHLSFASVGNIEARVIGSPAPVNFIYRRGIVGLNAPSPVESQREWSLGEILVLYSDGIANNWRWQDFAGIQQKTAAQIAHTLLNTLVSGQDDATVLVAKPLAP